MIMAQLETLSTPGLVAGRNIEFRDAVGSNTFSPGVSDPANLVHFTGQLTRTVNGTSPVRIAEVYSDPQIVRHTSAQASHTRAQVHFLHLQLDGESLHRQDQREARMMPGDITICDNSRPYEIVFEKPNRMLVFGFADELMRRYVQYPQSIAAMHIPGNKGIGGLLSDFLINVWRRCQDDDEFEINAAVADAILGLVANTYRQVLGSTLDHNSLGAAHRIRIINYIEENLGDPKLTPTRIAGAFRITTRYLHHLFSEEQETVARYILRRRLEECARALTSPSQRRRTITSIAFDHGFSSATHFGRVFRSRYNLTPREYRQQNSIAA
jgi:AraC family transcriptional activator of tynA and feaB